MQLTTYGDQVYTSLYKGKCKPDNSVHQVATVTWGTRRSLVTERTHSPTNWQAIWKHCSWHCGPALLRFVALGNSSNRKPLTRPMGLGLGARRCQNKPHRPTQPTQPAAVLRLASRWSSHRVLRWHIGKMEGAEIILAYIAFKNSDLHQCKCFLKEGWRLRSLKIAH